MAPMRKCPILSKHDACLTILTPPMQLPDLHTVSFRGGKVTNNPALVTSVLKVFGLNHISLVIKEHHGGMGKLTGAAYIIIALAIDNDYFLHRKGLSQIKFPPSGASVGAGRGPGSPFAIHCFGGDT
eukprot:scaffold56240_cov38-Cyclotella_meneghiniana.AAC.3